MDTIRKTTQFKLESVRIGLVSAKKIKQWAERTLPNGKTVGQVTTSQTLNYKTLKPYPGGLFCERIFGPIKDFQCSCGRKKSQAQQTFCPDCEVEYTKSRLRRYRLGYIQLSAPVTHVWYLKSTPSYIALLLDMSRKQVEALAYCTESIKVAEAEWLSDIQKTPSVASQPQEAWISPPFEAHKSVTQKTKKNQLFQPKFIFKGKNSFSNLAYKTLSDSKKQESLFGLGTGYRQSRYYQLKTSGFISAKAQKDLGFLHENTKLGATKYPPLFDFLCGDKSPRKENQINFIADFYGISKNFSAEMETDWDAFLSYMESIPLEKDFAIPIYKNFLDRRPSKDFFQNPKSEKTGAEALYVFLSQLDLVFVEKQLRHELFELNEKILNVQNQSSGLWPKAVASQEGSLNLRTRKNLKILIVARWKKIRRLKIVRSFRRTLTRPEWMILTVLPVLPPDLRPALPMNGNLMISDLNSLYKLVLDRNRRIKEAKEDTPETRKMRLRLLQEAVDSVIENGKGGANPISDKANKRPLKSLADLLKGKQGRFRENLLGKRVDYSGRSVIVVGPALKIHECGLPKEMAIALFQPFLIRYLLKKNLARTIVSAKRLIASKQTLIWDLLYQILETHPVLLNRAPTLHRLNIQAFQAKLVEGKAILLHPLVCSAFNADFDGDQMGVHVPLSSKARAEAWSLLWSRNNLLSPATGQPLILPSQDMVLGCYYATTIDGAFSSINQIYFSDTNSILKMYQEGKLHIHCWIWLRWNNLLENSCEQDNPIELRIDIFGNCLQIYSLYQRRYDYFLKKQFQYIRTTPGRILLNYLLFQTIE